MSAISTDIEEFWHACAIDTERRVFIDEVPDEDGYREARLDQNYLDEIDRMMHRGKVASQRGCAERVGGICKQVDAIITHGLEVRRLIKVVAEFRFATEREIYHGEGICRIDEGAEHEVRHTIDAAFAAADDGNVKEVARLLAVARGMIDTGLARHV